MATDAQKKAVTEYHRRQDNIMLRPSKADGAKIRAAAAAAGLSVQRFCIQILLREIDGQPDPETEEKPQSP